MEDWRAMEDARVLTTASEIKADNNRLAKAVEMLDKISEEAKAQKNTIMSDLYPSMDGM